MSAFKQGQTVKIKGTEIEGLVTTSSMFTNGHIIAIRAVNGDVYRVPRELVERLPREPVRIADGWGDEVTISPYIGISDVGSILRISAPAGRAYFFNRERGEEIISAIRTVLDEAE